MGSPDGADDVLVERGAVLAIAGCVLLYLAFLATTLYDRAPMLARVGAAFLAAMGGWSFIGGLLGLLNRPESTRLAGGTYAAAGWIMAAGGARAFAEVSGPQGIVLLAVALGLAAMAEVYGAALVQGRESPIKEDPLTRRMVAAAAQLVPERVRRRRP